MDQITTYATLQAAVAGMIHRADDTDITDNVPLAIQLCEKELFRELLPKNFESDESLTLTTGQNYVALPSGFISAIALWLVISSERTILDPALPQELPYSSSNGQPTMWAIDGANVRFDCPAAENYSAKLRCLKSSALSGSNTTNYILTEAPDIYLYGTLKHIAVLADDDRNLQKFAGMYEKAKADFANTQNRHKSIAALRNDIPPSWRRSDIRRGE